MKIITCFGADHKVGTTMISQSIAEAFAEVHKERKVILLHLDGTAGTEYSQQEFHRDFDEIKAALSSRVLKKEELNGLFVGKDNLYEMRGMTNYLYRNHIHPDDVQELFSLLEADLVIIDAGNDCTVGASVGALQYSNFNVLIANQSAIALERYQRMSDQALSMLGIRFHVFLCNQYRNQIQLLEENELKKAYHFRNCIIVPYSKYGIQAEQEHKSILSYHDSGYQIGVFSILKWLQRECGFQEKGIEKENGLFRAWKGVKK